MTRGEAVLALFIYVDDFLSALRTLRADGHNIETTFSPIPVHEVEEILGKKPSQIPFITFFGGVCGGLAVLVLAIYAHLSFNFITGGKPVLAWVPWVVVVFEGTIFGAVLAGVVAWILGGRLPRLHTATGYDPDFSQDRFGILVACAPDKREQIERLLGAAGAGEVRHITW